MKIIINADDFGPIDFINQGIYVQVIAGNLDSVQTLVNLKDQEVLYERLLRLHDCIPNGRTLDVGVHFTLTSGSPLYGRSDKSEVAKWGDMVKVVKGEVQFRPYDNFDFGYSSRMPAIREEFKAQKELLQTLVDRVNTTRGKGKMEVTSTSSHHNLLTIAEDLFDTYVQASDKLKLRSPKMIPSGKSSTYYGFALPVLNFFNGSDLKGKLRTMKEMNKAFGKNEYLGNGSRKFGSPAYIDVEFYKDLGSLTSGKPREKLVEQRRRKFEDMIKRAEKYRPNPEYEPTEKIIEFVFHLGTKTPAMKDLAYKDLTEGYPGVTHKYFDNREVEVLALSQLSGPYAEYIRENVSWKLCGDVTYK